MILKLLKRLTIFNRLLFNYIYLKLIITLVFCVALTQINAQILSDFPCYAVAEDNGAPNFFFEYDPVSKSWANIGVTGTGFIESIATDPINDIIYAMDNGTLGTIDAATGAFSQIATLGTADGAIGNILMNDVDGLSYDPANQILWASQRISGEGEGTNDLLFKIDPATAAIIPGEFVNGDDYAVVEEVFDSTFGGPVYDVDDIAYNPYTGILYAIQNQDGPGVITSIDQLTGEVEEVIIDFPDDDVEGLGITYLSELYGTTGNNGSTGSQNTFIFIDIANNITETLNEIDSTGNAVDFESFDCLTAVNDLALQKVISSIQPQPILSGDVVTYQITVFNQGDISNEDIVISDYIPMGLSLADQNWSSLSPQLATYTIPGPLDSGESITFDINLKVEPTANGTITNYAEISQSFNEIINIANGDVVPLPDVDSEPNNVNDETGDIIVDDQVNGSGPNANQDEDDHDIATFVIGNCIAAGAEYFPCYTVSEDNGAPNTLYLYDQAQDVWTEIGVTGTAFIEAIAADPINNILYAMDGGTLGRLNTLTGAFTSIATLGVANGENGPILIDDVDGLTYDPINNLLIGSHRISGTGPGTNDILIRINPLTGALLTATFEDSNGNPADYAVVEEAFDTTLGSVVYDVDDIALNPYTSELYAIQNQDGPGLITIINALNGELGAVVYDTPDDDLEGLGFNGYGELFATSGNNGSTGSQNSFIAIDYLNSSSQVLSAIDPTGENVDFESFDCFAGYNDLALRQTLAPGQESPFCAGEIVTFEVEIFNQGLLTNENILITNYFSPEFELVIDGVWVDQGNQTATASIPCPLSPGESSIIEISFKISDQVACSQDASITVDNFSEITVSFNSFFVDENEFQIPLQDIDSDSDFQNDETGIVDNEINEQAISGDEDDHDIETITVSPANPSAGTLSASNSVICSSNNVTVISASPNGNILEGCITAANPDDIVIPDGYQLVYVLTEGADLVILDVSTTPSFTVNQPGNYTIHSFVYNENTLDTSLIIPGTTTGTNVNGLLLQGGGSICAALNVAGASISVNNPSAGSLTAVSPVVCFNGTDATLEATSNGDAVVPNNYSTIYVLTSGADLIIEAVDGNPQFTVNQPGDYTIHTLVYDPNTLNLSTIALGTTTGFDVNALLTQGGGDICAALDVVGTPITIQNPDAGTLTAVSSQAACLIENSATLIAEIDVDPQFSQGYEIIYVLTSGDDLVIEATAATPNFTVSQSGDFTIHTLIYDPNTLDLSAITPRVTTGFEVNALLVQGGGDICGALDVAGIPFKIGSNIAVTFEDGYPVNATCGELGAALIEVSGGTEPYQFSWSDGFALEDRPTIEAGNYSLTVTDSFGCTGALDATILGSSTLDLTITETCELTVTGADAILDYTISGGNEPYSIEVTDANNNMVAPDLSGATPVWNTLSEGQYTLTISDANDCSTIQSFVICPYSCQLEGMLESIVNVSCNGGNDGSINISATTNVGADPITYVWVSGVGTIIEGETQPSLNNISAGTYEVKLEDINGCIEELIFEVTEPPAFVFVDCNSEDVSTTAGNDGTATLIVNGGVAPYMYSWSNGQTNNPAVDLSAGTYDATVTDANGCELQATCTVQSPSCSGFNVDVNTIQASCFGESDGIIEITATGTSGSVTYSWTPNIASGPLASNLSAGMYQVLVMDAVGCEETITAEILEPAELSGVIGKSDVVCFNDNNGTLDLQVSGGTEPYNYLWSNGVDTEDQAAVGPANYTVTVRDANGCTIVRSDDILEPAELIFSPNSIVIENVSCNGETNGGISVAVEGGSAPYQYTWSNGENTPSLSGYIAGSYSLTVADNNGCNLEETFEITEPEVLTIDDCNSEGVSTTGGADGTATIVVSGGTAPYNYLWSDGQTTNPAVNLAAGSYNVVITDSNGCTVEGTCTLQEPSCLGFDITINTTDATCGEAGSASLDISGGTAPYQVAWSDGFSLEDRPTIDVGNYSVSVTDAVNCSSSIEVTILGSSILELAITETCETTVAGADAVLDYTVTGGNQPYTIEVTDAAGNLINPDQANALPVWNTLSSGQYDITVSDVDGCNTNQSFVICPYSCQLEGMLEEIVNASCNGSNDGSITISATTNIGADPITYVWLSGDGNIIAGESQPSLNNIAVGTYEVRLEDVNGCTEELTFEVTEPPAFVFVDCNSEDVTTTSGMDGTATIIVNGGIAPYSYLWSDGQTTNPAINLGAGTYDATVTDANGCELQATCTVQSPSCSGFNVDFNATPVSCFGESDGVIEITATGTSGSVTYSWTPNIASGPLASNLSAGMYQVLVMDAVGCEESITAEILQPVALNGVIGKSDVVCFEANNGTLDLQVSGGTEPYSFLWSNSEVTEDQTDIGPGNYTVTVEDANGCTIVRSDDILEPTELIFSPNSIVIENVSCNGETNGGISVAVEGGFAPYQYTWSNGENTPSLSGSIAGSYSLTVVDNNGCNLEETFEITEPEVLTIDDCNSEGVSTTGGADGTATIVVSGGTAPYNYLWSDGQTTNPAVNLAAGSYNVVITDSNGCTVEGTCTLQEPSCLGFDITINTTDATCGEAGSASLDISGGTAPYQVAWSDGFSLEDRPTIDVGNYSVSVTDAVNCSSSIEVTILGSSILELAITETCETTVAGADAVLDYTVTGGNQPYTIEVTDAAGNLINPDQANALPVWNTLSSGQYDITVSDVDGCNTNQSFVICPYSCQLEGMLEEIVNASCNGSNDGSITISATTNIGADPITYVWLSGDGNIIAGESQPSLNNIAVGTYEVRLEDVNGCTEELTFEVTEPPAFVFVDCNSEDVTTTSGMDGTATIIVNGGIAPYSYLWSDGQTTNPAINLGAGTYDATVTDANGCELQATCTVQSPSCSGFNVDFNATPVSCFGESDGVIEITATGTSGSVTYSWTPNIASGPLASNLSAGMYQVLVMDAVGCEESITAEILQPVALNGVIGKSDVVCFEANNGTLDLQVSGGTEPYSFLWSNSEVTEDQTDIGPGNYTVTVEDANGCTIVRSDDILEPTELIFSPNSIVIENVSCNGETNGGISVAVEGGFAPYQYTWSNGENTPSLSGSIAGSYSLTVVDNNGCSLEEDFEITEPEVLSIVDCNAENVSTTGGVDGTATVVISGGTAPYNYLWSDGQTTNPAVNLAAGSYNVVVTDVNNCETQTTCTVQSPSCSEYEIIIASNVPVSCFGEDNGVVSVAVTAASGSVEYIWMPNIATGSVSTNLPAGTYTITAIDAVGCEATATANVIQPNELVGTIEKTDIICFGEQNGTLSVNVSGGTEPYQYLWSNGQTVKDLVNIGPGTYTVTITDNSGCTIVLNDEILQPTEFEIVDVNNAVVNASCNGSDNGSISVTTQGGAMPYEYLWSNGETTPSLSGAVAGFYSLTVVDNSGCNLTEDFEITEPEALFAVGCSSSAVTITGGADGTASVQINGGTQPYTYLWSNGQNTNPATSLVAGTYDVTVTDANGCQIDATCSVQQPSCSDYSVSIRSTQNVTCFEESDGSIEISVNGASGAISYNWSPNVSSGSLATSLTAGTYEVTAFDGSGCESATTVEITQPEELTGTTSTTNVSCFEKSDGSITVELSGGSTPYTYLWSNGSSVEDIENIGPGSYTLTLTDNNGCVLVMSDEIVEPTEMTLLFDESINLINVSCNGLSDGAITAGVEGGTAPYTYLWSTGETTSNLENLAAGFYDITITDSNNCSIENTFEVTETEALVFVDCNSEDVTTTGGEDGTATVVIAGGTTPYTYSWSNGQTTNPAINLAAGTYDVSVIDANGCETNGTCSIQGVSCRNFDVDVNINQISCNNSEDGSIEILVIGGSGQITYDWVPEISTTAIGSNLSAGSYAIQVTDEVGCTEIITTELNNPTSINGSISKVDVLCNGADDGSLDLQLSGGTPPYSYSWNNGATQEDLSNLAPADYSVTAIDANGCIFIISETITETPLLQEEIPGEAIVSDASCTNDAAGSIDISITGGTLPYTYQWSSGEITEDINNLTPGNYFVTVTDANDCTFGVAYDVLEASSCSSDLALIVELAPGEPTEFKEGDDITFVITLVNQGEDDLDDVTIVDYFPTGLSLNDPFWESIGGNVASLLIGGTLTAGSTTIVDITFTVNSAAPNGFLLNYAEVASATNSLGNPYQDVDSTPDTINGNDAGAAAGSPTDNTFDGNGTDDEDDHDVASLFIQSFDLALQTTLSGSPGTAPGEALTLLVTITNQGSIDAYNIIVNQSISDNLILNDSDWTQIGNIITTTFAGPLLAGEVITIPVDFILSEDAEPGVLIVVSELGGATLEDGTPANDTDSTPDTDFMNDAGGAPGTPSDNPIIGNGTGVPGGSDATTDEDDHDPVIIVVEDLLIDLELDINLDPRFVEVNDVVTWTINVENKGPADASDVDIVNDFGNDLVYLNDNSGGSYISETGIWVIGDLAVGESTSIEVLTTVDALNNMELTSQVRFANEDDVDSTPNNNIEAEDDQDSDAPQPNRSISLQDPCNCENGIDIDGDGNIDFAYEGIIITSASIGENWTLTSATGLVNSSGLPLTSATLENSGDGNYLLPAYAYTDGVTGFSAIFQETETGTTLSINGDACSPCLVTTMNNPPNIGPDQQTCTEPITPIAICVNDFDPDGDNVSILTAETTFNCSIEIFNDTCFTYIPLPGLIDVTDTIFVVACDDGNPPLCDEMKVLVDIREDCDFEPPICESNPIILDCTEFVTPLEICVPDFCKLDDDTEMIDDAETIFNCSIELLEDNCFKYTPLPGIDGVDTVYIYGSDVFGALDTIVAYIIVTDDCDTYFEAIDDETDTNVNEPVTINVLENDNNNSDCKLGDLALSIVSQPSNGTVTINADGTFEYTPNEDFVGQDSFEYEVCCLSVCDVAIVTISINDAMPMANNDQVSTEENVPVTINILENDDPFFQNCDIDDLTIEIVSAPFSGLVAIFSIDSIVYTPNENFVGEDSFEYEVCCADVCDIALVSVTVNSSNLPMANNDQVSTEENVSVTINVLENDDPFFQNCDSDDLTIDIVSAPFSGSVIVYSIGNIIYTPDEGFIGEDNFEYEVCCVDVCDRAVVSVIVNGENNPPIAINDEFNTQVNQPVTIEILGNDSDPDGDDIEVVFIDEPNNGNVIPLDNGSYIYVPDSGFVGIDSFTYVICDVVDPPLCDTATVYINVSDNNPPVIVDNNGVEIDTIFATTLVDTPFDDCITAIDPDGDNITIDILDAGNNGILVFTNDSCFIYTPDSNYVGIDTLIFTACDDGIPPLCDTVWYIIEVIDEDLIPTANPDEVETPVNTPITIQILENDILEEGEPVTITITEGPTNGSVIKTDDDQIVYTPDSSYVGIDSFIYEVCDVNSCDTAIVYINIFDPNLALELVDDTYQTDLSTPITFNVCENDIFDGVIDIIFFEQPTMGTVIPNNDVVCEFTYIPNGAGVDCFNYIVENELGQTDTAQVCIFVEDVCDSDIQNTLTPNGDGINDIFSLDRFVTCCNNPEVIIFNRWGGIVYDNKDVQQGESWRGEHHSNAGGNDQMLPDGTYFYCVICTDPNDPSKVEKLTGFIHLDQ